MSRPSRLCYPFPAQRDYFGIAALVFAIVSSDQLVLIAHVSFAGTSMLAPMVLAAVLTNRAPGKAVILATFVGLLVFLASVLNLVPSVYAGIRLDMGLLLIIGLITLSVVMIRNKFLYRNFKVCAVKKNKPPISQMTPIFICEIYNFLSYYQNNEQRVVQID